MAEATIPQKQPYPQRAFKPLPEQKACSRCKEVMPAASFYTQYYTTMTGRKSVKLSAECRECHQNPMRRGRKPARSLPSHHTCKHCGNTKTINLFSVKAKTAKCGTVSYAVSGKCHDCVNVGKRRLVRKVKALWDLPESKRCNRCHEVKDGSCFKIRPYKTSTGRDSRKLHSMCDPCRRVYEYSKFTPKGTPKGIIARPIDEPKKCNKCCVVKEAIAFGVCKRPNGKSGLNSYCKECRRKRRTPLEKRREYDSRRREKEALDPGRLAKKKAWHAENFQQNKERIRLRNMQRRRDRPDIVRARAIASALRRKSFGDDRRLPEIKAAVSYTLDAYRIGDQYWDVYESCLIDIPTIDHITAISRGGDNTAENMCVTSLANNSSKGTLPLIVWLAKRAARSRKQPSQS